MALAPHFSVLRSSPDPESPEPPEAPGGGGDGEAAPAPFGRAASAATVPVPATVVAQPAVSTATALATAARTAGRRRMGFTVTGLHRSLPTRFPALVTRTAYGRGSAAPPGARTTLPACP